MVDTDEAQPDPAHSASVSKTSLIEVQPEDEPFIASARTVVEECIDRLVASFQRDPCIHRVEHSLHIQLFNMLAESAELGGAPHPIGRTGFSTGLIHKEWPE